MARAHFLKSSRVDHDCDRGHIIPAGEPYYWAAPGYRARKHYRCTKHPFRPSDLVSGLRSQALAAVENLEDSLANPDQIGMDEISSAWEDFVQEINDYRDQRQEALDAWENGNSQLEEYLDTAENAASEAESWEPEDFYDDLPEDDDDSEEAEEVRAAYRDHIERQAQDALDLAQGLEF